MANAHKLTDVEYDTLTLDKIRQRLALKFDRFTIETLGVDMFYDQLAKQMTLRIERWFVGQHMPTHTFERTERVVGPSVIVPATWWDHFKQVRAQRWWFAWFVKRWPAKTIEHRLEKIVTVKVPVAFDVLYPDFRPHHTLEKEVRIVVPRYPY